MMTLRDEIRLSELELQSKKKRMGQQLTDLKISVKQKIISPTFLLMSAVVGFNLLHKSSAAQSTRLPIKSPQSLAIKLVGILNFCFLVRKFILMHINASIGRN